MLTFFATFADQCSFCLCFICQEQSKQRHLKEFFSQTPEIEKMQEYKTFISFEHLVKEAGQI